MGVHFSMFLLKALSGALFNQNKPMEAIVITKYDINDKISVQVGKSILTFTIRSITVTKTLDDELGVIIEVVYIIGNKNKFYAIEENEIICKS